MVVAILGGGNIGMCLAGEISRLKRYEVILYASEPKMFLPEIQVMDDEKGITYQSGVFYTTHNLKEAVGSADFILCTLPAFMRRDIINAMEDDIKAGAYLGFFPGYGGAEFCCGKLMEKGVVIFALQRVPYVSRTKERGKTARIMSKKTCIFTASMPMEHSGLIAGILEDMLLIKCRVLDNYMAATLLAGNPLVHTGGSCVLLNDYKKGYVFKEQIYYYQSWNDECSEMVLKFSDELHEVCSRMPMELGEVETIQEHYEVSTPGELTEKFHSIPSLAPLTMPMLRVEEGYIPDFSARFYTEDIPFGVCIIKALAVLADVQTPTADRILEWYFRMTGKEYFAPDGTFGKDIGETAVPQLFGIDSCRSVRDFYTR